MKKLVALLVVMAVVAPAMAGTTVSCAQVGTTAAFTVSYAYDGTGSFPRAFALDITTSKGTFSAVTAAKTGESVSGSTGFGIFPGTIVIDTAGVVTGVGSPVAPYAQLPAGTKLGIGSNQLTVELGSLYANTAVKPAASGVLVTVAMTGLATSADTATLTIVPNTARGGLVLEDATSAATFSSSCSVMIPAAPSGCACKGNVDGNAAVNNNDVIALVGKLNTYGGTKAAKAISSSNVNFSLCGDADLNGINNNNDVIKIVGWLNTYGGTKAAKTIACPHTYN